MYFREFYERLAHNQGKYTAAVHEVLDTDRKTILHIPSVQSGESTKDKMQEVDSILDSIGTVERQDPATGVIEVREKAECNAKCSAESAKYR